MMQVPMEVFSYTKEAAVLTRGSRIIYANAAAREILGEDCQNRSVASVFGTELAESQASNFVADLFVAGKSYSVRATRQDCGQLIFITAHQPEPGVVSDAFVYSVRSSLMTLNMALELCRSKAEEQENQEILSTMREITRSQYRLTRIVSNVSLLREHMQGMVNVALLRVDIGRLCRECADCLGSMLDNVKISVNAPEGVFINADPMLINKLLSNLISNSIIHGQTLSRISLNLSESPDCVFLSVNDDGCGIEGIKLHRAFERYRHIYELGELNGGAGLGLSVARIIAQCHGGTLLMESKPGQGTSVRISLKKNRGAGTVLKSSVEQYYDIKTALMEMADCLDSKFYGEAYMD